MTKSFDEAASMRLTALQIAVAADNGARSSDEILVGRAQRLYDFITTGTRLELHDSASPPPIPSESDERTANNAVRHQYRQLTDAEKNRMLRVKDLGAAFLGLCDEIGYSRELSLAKTKIEEAVMWAVKHVTA